MNQRILQPPLLHQFLLDIFLLMASCAKINVRFNRSSCQQSCALRNPFPVPCFGFSLVCTCVALFAPICARFALCFALVSLMTLPKLAPVKEYKTTELDFRSNPKNMLESNCGGNTLQHVNLSIEPGWRHKLLRHKLLLRWMEAPGLIWANYKKGS